MKIFLSHNMNGVSEEEIIRTREYWQDTIRNRFGPDTEFIDNYTHPDAPENAPRLWHLGRSIQQMSEADAVFFFPGMSSANGCTIEKKVCKTYGIKILSTYDLYHESRISQTADSISVSIGNVDNHEDKPERKIKLPL